MPFWCLDSSCFTVKGIAKYAMLYFIMSHHFLFLKSKQIALKSKTK